MFEVKRLDIHKNPFIGLFFSCSENVLIYSPFLQSESVEKIKSVLKPDRSCCVSVGSSHLTGLFTVLNSHGVVVPEFIEENEMKKIERETGLKVCTVESRFSAVKNNVLANDEAGLVNQRVSKTQREIIAKCLGVGVEPKRISGLSTVGAINLVTNNGLIGYNNASDAELHVLSQFFNVPVVRSTCNFGTSAVGLGVVANCHGALVGSASTGFELGNVYAALSGDANG